MQKQTKLITSGLLLGCLFGFAFCCLPVIKMVAAYATETALRLLMNVPSFILRVKAS